MSGVNEKFRILRVCVEDQAPVPSVVVVSSALRNDGASYVATGLARAFAESRHRTLLIDANGNDTGAMDGLAGIQTPRLSVRAMFGEDTKQDVGATLDALRKEFDVVIVDAPPVPGSSLALSLARASDGVILAVRLGRRISEADNEMMRLLSERRILGVVPTGRPEQSSSPARVRVPQPVAEMFERLLGPARRAAKGLR